MRKADGDDEKGKLLIGIDRRRAKWGNMSFPPSSLPHAHAPVRAIIVYYCIATDNSKDISSPTLGFSFFPLQLPSTVGFIVHFIDFIIFMPYVWNEVIKARDTLLSSLFSLSVWDACLYAAVVKSDYLSYCIFPVSSEQSNHSTWCFSLQTFHKQEVLFGFFAPLCVNSRDRYVWKIPGDLHFLRFSNQSIWHQQLFPGWSHRDPNFFSLHSMNWKHQQILLESLNIS